MLFRLDSWAMMSPCEKAPCPPKRSEFLPIITENCLRFFPAPSDEGAVMASAMTEGEIFNLQIYILTNSLKIFIYIVITYKIKYKRRLYSNN